MKRFVIILVLGLWFIAGCGREAVDRGTISVYFCPQDDCEQVFLDFVNSAQSSLYCALYDVGLQSAKDALSLQSEVIDVKLVTDNNNYGQVTELGIAKADNSSALMHNKFCVADGKRVLTGSYNPTYSTNLDNIVIIESELVASNYLDEFAELWSGVFGNGAESVPVAGSVESLFCPEDNCADKLKQEVRRANHSIYFMVFSFTDNNVASELILKKYDGIAVNGIFENSQQSQYSVFDLLKFQGINVTYDGKTVLHHKVFIIDSNTVVTGSANPTKNGFTRNDENILIIHDEGIARQYLDEFDRIWYRATAAG